VVECSGPSILFRDWNLQEAPDGATPEGTSQAHRATRGLAVRLFPLTRKRPPVERISDEPRIIAIDPRVAFGRPVITGSQIPTVEVAERFKAGESVADLADDFRRPQEEIEEAVRIELDLEAA
jgi:uncharacterized protein (DUF433 family)